MTKTPRFEVECQECGKKFKTTKMCPECPKCGGCDIDLPSSRGQASLPAILIGFAVALTATFGIAAMGGHLEQWANLMARLSAAILGG